jgi:hypothetical protein
MHSFPEPFQFNGDEPDPFTPEQAEAERYALRADEAAQLERYLSRMSKELERTTREPNMSAYERRRAIRSFAVQIWNESRRLAGYHDALMVERPTT